MKYTSTNLRLIATCISTSRAQDEQQMKDENAELQNASRRQHYAQDIREQISEKEKDRVQLRKTYFEEGEKLNKEAKERSVV